MSVPEAAVISNADDKMARDVALAEYRQAIACKKSLKHIFDNHMLVNTALLSLHNPGALASVVLVPMTINGTAVTFEIQQSATCGVGGLFWRSSEILAQHVITHLANLSSLDTVVELGCGAAALPSMVAAIALPAAVIATDTESVLGITRANIDKNTLVVPLIMRGSLNIRQCDWEWAECPPFQADAIIAADVIYTSRTQSMLVSTIGRILKPDGVLLLTYAQRDKCVEEDFFNELLTVGGIATHIVDTSIVNEQIIYTVRGTRVLVVPKDCGGNGIFL